uniref:Uncharacterized protein n=1 Tax=Brassica oleracea var. oleracea TaxID=109376 RepID=A0A0D3A269_BRAOL
MLILTLHREVTRKARLLLWEHRRSIILHHHHLHRQERKLVFLKDFLRPCVVAALWMNAAATRPLYALIKLFKNILNLSLCICFFFVYDGVYVISVV